MGKRGQILLRLEIHDPDLMEGLRKEGEAVQAE